MVRITTSPRLDIKLVTVSNIIFSAVGWFGLACVGEFGCVLGTELGVDRPMYSMS